MKLSNKFLIIALLFAGITACDFFDPDIIEDPNNSSLDGVLNNASKAQLQNLVTGLEIRHRAATGSINIMSSFGREIYPTFASDPRFINQWIGQDPSADAESDPSFFGSGGTYTTPYRAIKQANVLMQSAQNTEVITSAERSGILGFAKTIQAYQYLIPLNAQFDNGIRFDVADVTDLGPFLSYDDALQQIRNLLDEGLTDLNSAGNSFVFTLTGGMDEFNTPATMADLNRAIAARAAIYAEDWDAAVTAAEAAAPFFELTASADAMNKGGYFVYGDPPDIFNPFFYTRNTTSIQLPTVHPELIADTLAGDERVDNKFFLRDTPVVLQGLTANYQDNRFGTTGAPFPFFRNEELVLIYAEALAQRNQGTDLAEAVDAINVVRNTWGLGDFISVSQSAIIDEVLFQRRYSLWLEGGHRWIDMRRYDRLDELPLDGGKIYSKIARPLSEL
ncbi:MAG: RagB/SusD family nutrient uptake outer membrane protein [Balneola sp.]|nr:RagB/SusD family nutrient uptake outer membrane protein [Balneola sp.]MBO6650536.1 RagB/SusD family nutrient uptake outer membrane protein [Balneola sp.]MBO6711533.1 RagB/SusD family nutrient uptake outer membrane protein [Balneola sp.]MBO6799729.1 RagB/SusD family nutrient uptake outer membrane protein [Balneola sp.]MBO6870830.1 RagB/SusD family nutrient uptake outer membrane protein [Balneola sp.]